MADIIIIITTIIINLPLEEPESVGVGAGDVVERMVEPMDGDGFSLADVELLDVEIADFFHQWAEFERETQGLGEVS